ncbi:Zinc finger BED domain-containing hypothetical protein [Phytophthora megakarya]|uniref:HAT C-terminal dimerisation domain-containing protein n=1 Tax=Phytophthora megakarya TaxID=4795 RepID=A0A225WHN2_9STRA|nr:Zinc finger BED domain-containing hypothetical protein [Phytophthora megakarya]
MPSRRTISERLQTYAQQKRKDMDVAIVACAMFYNLTNDIWTSRITESLLALTIHFMTAAYKIRSHPLEIVSFPGNHTGVLIAKMIKSLMIKWGLDPLRLTKILRDIGSNVVKACDELGVDQLGCVAHSHHLVVSGALSKTRDEVDEMMLIQAQEIHFDDIEEPEGAKERWVEDPVVKVQVIEQLKDEIEQLDLKSSPPLKASQNVPQPVTVITDVTARWNSTHHMLRRLLELRPALQDFLVGREEFNDVMIARPTGEMWFSIQCLDRLLVSFNGMTKLLSGEKYGTMPLILSSLRLVEMLLQKKKVFAKVAGRHEGELYYGPTLRRMHLVRRVRLVLLHKRFSKLPDDVKSCCLLDRQFAYGKYLHADKKTAAKLILQNKTMRLAGAGVIDFVPNTNVDVSSGDEDDFASQILGYTRKPSGQEPESPEELSLQDKVKEELKVYFQKCELLEKTNELENQARSREKDKREAKLKNALIWWKRNASDFPLLAPVFRKYFGVVATSVPFERCFSSAGNAITARQNRFTGDNTRDSIFLHNNQDEVTDDDESDASS